MSRSTILFSEGICCFVSNRTKLPCLFPSRLLTAATEWVSEFNSRTGFVKLNHSNWVCELDAVIQSKESTQKNNLLENQVWLLIFQWITALIRIYFTHSYQMVSEDLEYSTRVTCTTFIILFEAWKSQSPFTLALTVWKRASNSDFRIVFQWRKKVLWVSKWWIILLPVWPLWDGEYFCESIVISQSYP